VQPEPRGNRVTDLPTSKHKQYQQKILQLSQNLKSLFSQETRYQQRQSLASTNSSIISPEERKLNRNLVLLSGALVLTGLGSLLTNAPILLIGVGLSLYASVPVLIGKFSDAILKEKRTNMAALELTLIGLMFITGHFFALTLGNLVAIFSRKLITMTEDYSLASMVNVFEQQDQTVWVQVDDNEVLTSIEQLQVNDVVVVNAGEAIPVDGVVQSGIANIDQHALTGEAQPVEREAGDVVFASTIVLTGRIYVMVEKAGEETTAAQIRKILMATADTKTTMYSRGVVISDKTALPTLGVGALALLSGFTLTRTNALMNANFGYNMRVLAPIAMLNSLNYIAQQGILIKDGRALELLAKVDTVVFDKTGTLTQEQPHIGYIHTYSDYSQEDILTYAATAEYKQSHPIAKAILQKAAEEQLPLFEVDDAEYQVGYGLIVTIGNKVVSVGSRRFMELQEISIPLQAHSVQEMCHHAGHSLVMVAINQQLIGALEMHATVRPETKMVLQQLRERGLQSMYIISGDHEAPTQTLANELGIENYFANVLPKNKAAYIETLQNEGKTVCYIGDGINDSIALKQAQVSISLRGASTIATDTASIVLMDGSLTQLYTLFDHAKHLEDNFYRSLFITILPGFISMSGVLFFNFGIVTTILLNQAALAVGLVNSLQSPKISKSKATDEFK